MHAVVLPIGLQSARRSGQCDPSPAAIRAHAAWDAGHVGDLKSTHLAVLEDAVQRFVILRRSSTAHSLSLNQAAKPATRMNWLANMTVGMSVTSSKGVTVQLHYRSRIKSTGAPESGAQATY
eukprot:COSAG02_NODE_61_length_43452_cov_741.297804_13_plen_122_part_00